MQSETMKKVFPDWKNIQPGDWSDHGIVLHYGERNHRKEEIYIGLYREPLNGDENEGRYTLEILDGDDVIFCSDVV